MIRDDNDDQWYPGMDGAYVFPTFVLVEENTQKNLNQENWPERGSNPGPLGERQWCYPSTTAVVSLVVARGTIVVGNVRMFAVILGFLTFNNFIQESLSTVLSP